MVQPILLGGSRRREAPVLLHHRHACFDALVTDIYGRAGDKPANLVGAFAAERTAQSSSSSSLSRSSRETCLSVTVASSMMKSTTFSSKIGARMAATAAGVLR